VPPVEFRYRRETARGETVFRPVARVFLQRDEKGVLLYPYIDSGADVTLIPRSVGEALGLTLGNAAVEELAGIGEGKIAVTFETVKMSIGEVTFDCRVGWSLIEEVPLLLGRRDVFDRFAVLFREWERTVIFTPRSDVR